MSLAAEIQDPDIVRWLNVALPYTLDDAQTFVARTGQDWVDRTAAHFVISCAGSFAGYLGVLAVEAEMSVVEIVYWVAAAQRGSGLATRSLGAVLEWVETEIAPERVELGMIAGNAASARTATANGFTLDRVVADEAVLDGRPTDEHIYVLSR